jgi:DNA-binding CsgD family transcriptional regulator
VVLGSEKIPDRQFERTEHYHENCKPHGVFYAIGVAIPLSDSGDLGLISIHRARRYGCFDQKWKRQLQSLLPHLTQALHLRTNLLQLRIGHQVSLPALNALHLGTLVVDHQGYVLFSNSVAEYLIKGQKHLTLRHGRIQLDDPSQNAELCEAIRAMSRVGANLGYETNADMLFGIPSAGSRRLCLRVCPVPESAFCGNLGRPAAFLFISDVNAKALPLSRQLMRLYGFTAAEARLAEAVAKGQNLVEFCAHNHVSKNTAKTHLKHIFAKTGHRRQSQFVRDVLGNPILHMHFPNGTIIPHRDG